MGHAGHGGDHPGNVVAGLDLRRHPPRRAADTVEVGDRGAPEFHHDAGHRPLVPLRFLYDCGVIRPAVAAPARRERPGVNGPARTCCLESGGYPYRSEEHTSELQSLMRISYAVFCLKKNKNKTSEDETENE